MSATQLEKIGAIFRSSQRLQKINAAAEAWRATSDDDRGAVIRELEKQRLPDGPLYSRSVQCKRACDLLRLLAEGA